jgi:hypothetical protein
MFRNERLLIPFFALDDIIPALAKIEFDVRGGWTLDQGMGIVPVMWRGVVCVTSQGRKVVMEVGIPAVKVAIELDQHVDATNESVRAVYHRQLLMQ